MSNTLQSAVLILVLAAILGYTALLLVGPSMTILLVAGIVLFYLFSPRMSERVVMRMFNGRRLAPSSAPELGRIVQELSRRAGLTHVPTLYYLPQRMPNAFAVGTGGQAAIAVSDGLLRRLSLEEVAGVLAHEISHIAHNDLSVMTLAGMIRNLTRALSNVGLFLLFINLPMVLFGMTPVSWSAIFLLIFAPTLAGLVQLALSRVREFRADVGAAQLLGSPRPLIAALHKMDQMNRGLLGQLMPTVRLNGPSLFSTHPPTPERIERLHQLEGRPRLHDEIVIGSPVYTM